MGRVVTLAVQDVAVETALHHLINDCTPATFGRNGKDVYDESYRRAGALGAEHFMTDFCPHEAGIIDIITQLLLPLIVGDLKPEPPPPPPKSAPTDDMPYERRLEIYGVLCNLAINDEEYVSAGYVEQCLTAMVMRPASTQEMLAILGELDPAGHGLVLREKLIDKIAKRMEARAPKKDPSAPDLWQKWRRMTARGIRAEL